MGRKIKNHLCKNCGDNNPDNFRCNRKTTCNSCYKEYQKQHYVANSEYIKNKQKNYYQNNSESIKEYQKKHRESNQEYIKEYSKQYKIANAEYFKNYDKEYYLANKENIIEYQKEYKKQRIRKDPAYKFMCYLRTRQGKVLKGILSTTEGLGCNKDELIKHLSKQFQDGMTIENHGEWHIDHILPLASYDKDSDGNWCIESEYNKKLIHYTNLQPLWAEDNLSKGDKIVNNNNQNKK